MLVCKFVCVVDGFALYFDLFVVLCWVSVSVVSLPLGIIDAGIWRSAACFVHSVAVWIVACVFDLAFVRMLMLFYCWLGDGGV